MSWLNDLLGKVARSETVDFKLTPPLTVGGALPTLPELVPDASYLKIDVKALRLPFVRKGVTRFHGVVHSFVNIAGRGSDAVQFASASTPSALAGLDPHNVSSVLTINKRVVGPTPWNGGDLKLQIGLFSVVEQDLAGPFLSTITALSEQVGVAFAGAAKPFVDVIGEGVRALSRQEDSVQLEVGLDNTVDPPRPGYYALLAAPKGSLVTASFDLDPNDFRLKVDGQDYTAKPYLVFGIEAAPTQDRWGEIEELRKSYEFVREAIRRGDQTAATEAMKGFRLLALSSPDLITSDAANLVKKVDDLIRTSFGDPNRSRSGIAGAPDFQGLALYE